MKLLDISQRLLSAAKANQPYEDIVSEFSVFNCDELVSAFNNDDDYKKSFWINIYNAYATILLRPNPNLILNPIKRKAFFNKKQINISGCNLSLNDIEHNILRKSRVWWSKGYLKKCFVHRLEKQLRVTKLDPRIHFALNCGGMGCPPIRFYDKENIDNQLEMATQAFLFSEAKVIEQKNEVQISKLFNWYIGDFGGKEGLINFLRKYNIIPSHKKPNIVYKKYNWSPWIK